MIVKMRKFTLLTLEAREKQLIKDLQRFESVHFNHITADSLPDIKQLRDETSAERITLCEGTLQKLAFAMSKLDGYAEKPKGLKAMTAAPKTMAYDDFDAFPDSFDYEDVCAKVKACDERLGAIKSKVAGLYAENEGLKPWVKLDVRLTEFDRLKSVKCLIGAVNRAAADAFRAAADAFNGLYVEVIGNVKDDVVFFVIAANRLYDEVTAFFKAQGVIRLTPALRGVPAETIESNTAEIAELNKEREAVLETFKSLAGNYDKLQIVHDYYETALEREKVCRNFLNMRTSVVMEGYVPESDMPDFIKILDASCGGQYYIESSEADKDGEDVPIKLKNNRLVETFEDITSMFSLPKYNEIDPTPVMTPFYMIFFGLMLGDTGYGLLMMAATAAALKFFNFKESTRKFIKFFFYVSLATAVMGLIYGGVFGFTVIKPIKGADGAYKAIIDTQTDVIIMMLMSVALGVVQVLFGLGVKGYMLIRDGKVLDAIFDSLFWIVCLLSGISMILGFAGVLPEGLSSVVNWVFLISIIGLACTQGRENPTIVGKVAGGIYGVYGISSYIGDFVSYTRIAALALAGAYIGYSFNLMSSLLPAGIARIIGGTIILLIGHALNIGLSALGAYVHTCRLQYVEFFGKFFEGGGVPFNAFKLQNKYITIK